MSPSLVNPSLSPSGDRLLESLAAGPVLAALRQRLAAVAHALGIEEQDRPVGELLLVLVERCRESARQDEAWLLLVAVWACWPVADDVRSLGRELKVDHPEQVARTLLDTVLRRPQQGSMEMELEVVDHAVLVCADFCARFPFNSGIQRTVRRTLPRWERTGHSFVTAAYSRTGDGMRTLRPSERERVFDHSDVRAPDTSRDADAETRLLAPWHATVVLPEVPVGRVAAPLAAMAELSGSTVGCIGYDAIPIVHADLRRPKDSERFAQYLSVVKHIDRVAGISISAATEFGGFSQMLPAQGLPELEVCEVLLPSEPPVEEPVTASPAAPRVLPHTPGSVQVLCVGAKETHKNQRAVLHAAERLWREGLQFDLSFIGGRGWTPEQFEAAFDRLERAGRPIRHLGRLPDPVLDAAYREADVMVFLSLQEGFGLPPAEALSCGTPVLTSNFGSLAEIAADGGALLADPRDDDDVTAQLRRLVTDPELRTRLAEEARRRPVRTWDDYARELWAALVEPTA